MDVVLPKLLSFPPHPPPPNPLSDYQYDDGIKEQIASVKVLPNSTLIQKTSGGEHALDVINPAINTVPYTFILLANISSCLDGTGVMENEDIWKKIVEYLTLFDSRQIRYLGSEFTAIIEAAVNFTQLIDRPDLALMPIREALIRLDPTGAMLTSNHLLLVKLALECRCYDAIGPFLDNLILFVPDSNNLPKPKHLCSMNLSPTSYITSSSGLTSKLNYMDILEYFIYCGMACLGLRKWTCALKHFEYAITYPAKDAVSKPMIEAYKKWVLTGLIINGKLPILPRSTSGVAARAFHLHAKPYENLALVFENDTASTLKNEAENGRKVWNNDFNSGLVSEVLASYQKFQIQNLANIYCKISIPEIHEQTTSAETGGSLSSVSDTESLVLRMIDEGELCATMSSVSNGYLVLTFSSTGPLLTEIQVQKELAASKCRIQYISQQIRMTDRCLIHDKDYVKYLLKKNKGGKQDNGDNENQAVENAFNWNDIVEDEDIMGAY